MYSRWINTDRTQASTAAQKAPLGKPLEALKSVLMVLLAVGAACYSLTLQASSATENLHQQLSQIDSFRAAYKQLVLDQQGSRLQQSSGKVWLQRPGKFRWDTEQPFPQLLVSDGETLWLYDEDLEQVTQQQVDQRIAQTPALLLTGKLDDLKEAFDVKGPLVGDEGTFQLTPKDENALFVVLRVTFKEGLPVEMQMEDNLGQQTSLQFFNIEANPRLDSELFQFQVPEGVDLIVE